MFFSFISRDLVHFHALTNPIYSIFNCEENQTDGIQRAVMSKLWYLWSTKAYNFNAPSGFNKSKLNSTQ